ncbi:MAG: oligosaccharide flippase family protein [Pseudomonadota bacterium]
MLAGKVAALGDGPPPGRQHGLRAQLLRGGISGLLVRAGAILAGLVASVVLARVMGPETYGVYAFVFSLISLLGLPVKMGLPTLILRETARADQAADGALMRGIWRWSDRAMVLMAAAVLGLSGAYVWLVAGLDSPRMIALLCALPLVPLIGLAEARGAAIRGLRRVALGSAPDKILRPLLLAGAVAAVGWVWVVPLTAADVYLLHCGVAVVTVIVASVIVTRIRPAHPGAESPRAMPRAWIAAILPLSALAGLQVVNHNTDILMLGSLAIDAEVGLYRVALSGASIALFGLTTINLVMQPYFARACGAGNHRQLQRLATVGARLSLMGALPFLALFWFGGGWLLNMIYGEAYTGAFWALILLCFGQVVSAFFGSAGNLLTMSGREWIAAGGLLLSTLVNVGLNWLLIPRHGIEGAAIATGISIAVWNIALWSAAWTTLRVDSSPIGLRRSPPANLIRARTT